MRIETEIEGWDGKSSPAIRAIYASHSYEDSFEDEIIACIEKTPLQTGATWLLKHYLEDGNRLQPKSVHNVYMSLPHLKEWGPKLHILQSIPFLPIGKRQKNVVESFLRNCIGSRNKFVRAWTYNGFYELALQFAEYQSETKEMLKRALSDEAPSVKARVRAIMKKGFDVHVLLALALSVFGIGCAPPESGDPPRERTEPFPLVVLEDVDSTILQEMRYATVNNFVGEPINGYLEPVCLLTEPAAKALIEAQDSARTKGMTLKVYDCYRPQRAVSHFTQWAIDTTDTLMKSRFYPDVKKSTLFDDGYIARRSGHSRGSTVDLTLVPLEVQNIDVGSLDPTQFDCRAEPGLRYPDVSIDMGTGYDCFDELAHTFNEEVSDAARANRLLLKSIMEGNGFVFYGKEWWHFRFGNEPHPQEYFDFPVQRR